MTSLFAGKKPSRSRGGGRNRRPTPLMRLSQTARQRNSERKKKEKTWGGERGKKKFIIIKDKSYE